MCLINSIIVLTWMILSHDFRIVRCSFQGPRWYPLAEREERLFTNRSNRPGDDMKDDFVLTVIHCVAHLDYFTEPAMAATSASSTFRVFFELMPCMLEALTVIKTFCLHRWDTTLSEKKSSGRSVLLYDDIAIPANRCSKWFFFAGGCLGWSRAERPSVSWTKMLETLCLQQQKEMLNIKCVQKHAKGHRYQQVPNTEKKAESQRAQRRGLRWNPKESTYARVGRCNQGRGLWWNPKEAPVPEPEVRVRDRKGQRFKQVIKVGGH